MTCQYCTAKNEPEDERCQRCGRRIHTAHERPSFHRAPATNSSLARSLSFDTESRPETPARPAFGPQIVPPPVSAPAQGRSEPGHQASLFGPQEVPKSGRETSHRPSRHPVGSSAHKPRLDKNAQQSLEFVGPLPLGNHALKTSVEARIYCNAPIAQTPLRIMAAIADSCVGVVGVGVYVATFRLMGQELVWTNQMLLSCLAAAVVISLFYRVLYCLANGDTPGTRWAGLRLVDFDGRTPTRKQRFQRLAGGFVGMLAVGLGLFWALYDEERLTWHDQMSETFPTFRG
jgi:uncharacterized RDD family membrane protein YckC